ncbi:MAG: murein transglycosylase A [Rhizobiaceae bacterium]
MSWKPTSFDTLQGWADDDHLAALSCFRMSAKAFQKSAFVSRDAVNPSAELLKIAEISLSFEPDKVGATEAREFFESYFQPTMLERKTGFVTAYFEPEVEASRTRTEEFSYPLYRRPNDLVKLDSLDRPPGISNTLEYARKTKNGLVEYYDRKEIDLGALKNRGLELFWLRSPVDGFYIHVQGSARLQLQDGTVSRVSYAGKTGHPYTSIGKKLVERDIMTPEQANMINIRAWLAEDDNRALELLHQNRSFIFFTELEGHEPDFGPIAAAGVQLTPGRSIAVDKTEHAYGTPVWIQTDTPLPGDTDPFRRLMIAQDTGSAIVGPKRGDIFIGSGSEAGLIAGSVRHEAEFAVLIPRIRP